MSSSLKVDENDCENTSSLRSLLTLAESELMNGLGPLLPIPTPFTPPRSWSPPNGLARSSGLTLF